MPRLKEKIVKKTLMVDMKKRKRMVIDLLLGRRYTDEQIMRVLNNSFQQLDPIELEYIMKMRSKLNRGRIKGIKLEERIIKILK